jgi:gliding motility-associated-like protein
MNGSSIYIRGLQHMMVVMALLFASFNSFAQQDQLDIPDLIRITVDHTDNGVLIQWEASTDRTVDLYQMYSMNNGTGTPIFTFSADIFEYKHMTSDLVNLAYAVTAVDTLDGTQSRESLLGDNVHRAVSTSLEFDPCEPANTINWTAYLGWEGNISGYRVYGGMVRGNLEMLKFVNSEVSTYRHRGVSLDTTYTYYIETVHTSGMTSLSPIDSIETVFPDKPEFLRLDYVSVIDRLTVELQFTADIDGPANSFRVMKRGSGDSPYTEVETLWNSTQSTMTVQDQFPTSDYRTEYIVQSLYRPEGCNDPVVLDTSNSGTNVWLQSNLTDQIVHLSWTPYETYSTGLSGYIIQRKDGNGEFVDIHSVGPEINSWNETIESVINGFQAGSIQYKVLAVANQVEGADPGISVSNIVDVAVETHLQLPSAFTPGSNDMNSEFKPLLDFAPMEYIIVVFDRGGRKLFESTDPEEGWDGTYGGNGYVLEGAYVYYIKYTDFTGISKTLSGSVTAIYP